MLMVPEAITANLARLCRHHHRVKTYSDWDYRRAPTGGLWDPDRVPSRPTLHLMVGLPGVGKTSTAMVLAAETRALRLTPDDWMVPLFGDSDADGKRDVLEGRLLWVAHEVMWGGGSVVLDFGCWSSEERHAVRAVARHAGGRYKLHYLALPEAERRARCVRRWRETPETTFEMTDADQDQYVARFQPPTDDEIAGAAPPGPPPGHDTWLGWASDRWPSLPDFDLTPARSDA